jgi:hypothetical protein
MYITKDPGSWQQYVKRADNIGLSLQEVTKKFTMESNLFHYQQLQETNQHQIQNQIDQGTSPF